MKDHDPDGIGIILHPDWSGDDAQIDQSDVQETLKRDEVDEEEGSDKSVNQNGGLDHGADQIGTLEGTPQPQGHGIGQHNGENGTQDRDARRIEEDPPELVLRKHLPQNCKEK